MTPNDESRYIIRELLDVEELPRKRDWTWVLLLVAFALAALVPEGLR